MSAGKRVALIGCGTWGARILATLRDLQADVVVVETDAKRRDALGQQETVSVVEHIGQAGPVHGAIVATPASTHFETITDLIPYRIPIFVEKPLTNDAAEARRLAKHTEPGIFVMHIWHYHPGIRMLAAIAQSGELGAVKCLRTVRANWTSPRTDVDSVWTLMPHDLSIAKTILGRIPEPVFALAERREGQAVGMLAVLGEGEPCAILDTSVRYRDKRREVRLHCEKGVAVLPDDRSGFIEIAREGDDPATESPTETRGFEFVPPLRTELAVFLKHLDGGPPPPTGLSDGIAVVATISRLRQLAGLG